MALTGTLSAGTVAAGQELSVTLTEGANQTDDLLEYGVSDNQGNEWTRVAVTADSATYRTVPTVDGTLTVTSTQLRSSGTTQLSTTSTATVSAATLGMPGQIAGKVRIGMSTDNYAARVSETGAIGVDHYFISSWSPSEFINKCQAAHSRGLLPFVNMKTGDWGAAAGGSLDASTHNLGQQIAALNYPVRLCFHHEPGLTSPTGNGEKGTAAEWRAMQVRLYPIIKNEAPKAIVGPVDNGYKFSPNVSGQGWTNAQLNTLYTDAFLAVCDTLGADYYDGATTKTNGEPAFLKVKRADEWMTQRGWDGRADIGEFSFVRPGDCTDLWNYVKTRASRWWCILAFNSDNNNRKNIPTIGGGWNFTHSFANPKDRLNAFRAVLADTVSAP